MRRAAWRASGIKDYRIRLGMSCFCPLAPPTIIEVRNGVVVAVRDTTGRPAPPTVSDAYTVEKLFDLIERTAREGSVHEVKYNRCLGYPTLVSGDANVKMVDDWFVITADHMTVPR